MCCVSDKTKRGRIIHENVDRKIAEFLDIETLFSKYQDLDMMKKLLFDNKQMKLFEALSVITHLSIVFSSEKNESKDQIDFQEKDFHEEYFRNLSEITKRRNPMDMKILENYKSLLLD